MSESFAPASLSWPSRLPVFAVVSPLFISFWVHEWIAFRKKLEGYDAAQLVGAPVFRYYPYMPGPYVPDGLRLLHISDDPAETAGAPIGDSLLGDPVLSLEGLKALLGRHKTQTTICCSL